MMSTMPSPSALVFASVGSLLVLALGAGAAAAGCDSSSSDGTGGVDASTTPFDAGGTSPGSDGGTVTLPDTGAPGVDAGSDAGAEAGSGIGALRFDGVDDVLALPTTGVDETAFTWEVWFRSTATTGMLVEVHATTGGADRSLYLEDGKVCFYVYTPAFSELCSDVTYNDGGWHHAAGTLGAGGQHLYVDGVAKGEALTVTQSAFDFENALRAGYGHIGPSGPLVRFAGDMDEIRLWSVERTGSQIATQRSATVDPTTTGLQGYWKLDDAATSTTATDATANANHGVLTGFTPAPTWVSGAF